ncbi:MAG: FAD binding domain-containing protein [Hyphomicrobiaceae bacterium]|nr:FAD binding domain-containing protein [Hyphomicrobiaceae bacterium]
MKAAAFAYRRAESLGEAVSLLARNPDAKVMAGGQTLGPMLNLRLAQPAEIVDITRIPELGATSEAADGVTLGALVTHAAIEDGLAPDPTRGFLARVARGIAYRAVRTRGTVGGSLAHADPAADWLSCLTALGAEVSIVGPGGRRRVPLQGFVRGPLDTDLAAGEILCAVHLPAFSAAASFGYVKFCRKDGEFADAIGAALADPSRGIFRLAASTTAGAPIVIEAHQPFALEAIPALLDEAGSPGDGYERRLRATILKRATTEAMGS